MNNYFLKEKMLIDNEEALQPDYEEGTLILTHSQAVIDACNLRNVPVIGIELEDGDQLKCPQLIMDADEVEDDDYENMYRRCKGIPWEIAVTDRCFIREYCEDDLDDLFELYNQPHMTDYMEPLFEYEEEKEYERNYIEYIYKMYGFGMWLVFDKNTGELIGRAGIEVRETCTEENQAELGFAISSKRWHEGLAFEVCSKIIQLAKSKYELSSLIARCDPENDASRKLLDKLGFCLVNYENDGDCRYKKTL